MPSVYPLQCLYLAVNVRIELMQNLAKSCKLFIWCNLTDFAFSRCPILHIPVISHVLIFLRDFFHFVNRSATPASSQRGRERTPAIACLFPQFIQRTTATAHLISG